MGNGMGVNSLLELLFASHAALQVLLAAGTLLQIPSAPVLSSSPADVKHVKTSVS